MSVRMLSLKEIHDQYFFLTKYFFEFFNAIQAGFSENVSQVDLLARSLAADVY